ncbi:lag1 longevity assurance [Stylonychia lemnae]|uniref:Lag1 longevity assurance n=1 Tax=Stylonychia lemnae TaxID=5949 RepID=A0A078AXN2_STYLE|nr:lag1 longevity assurance [Stylonychia lemnae]|eukprot:CDW85563.1 lag1 longevity assurance [Stylonychia lemnae]
MSINAYLFYPLALYAFSQTMYQLYMLPNYVEYLKNESPGCYYTNPNKLSLFVGVLFIQICIQFPVMSITRSIFMKILPDKFPVGSKIREEKAEVIGERMYKLFIYSIATIGQFFILKQSKFLHVLLWGDQWDPEYFPNYPCVKIPTMLDDLYVLKISFHSYETLYSIVFMRKRRDFPEYILHHIITLGLVLFSYCTNQLSLGAVVMVTHDFTDCLVSVFKIFSDVVGKTWQYVSVFSMILGWIYFRLWFFQYYVIYKYYTLNSNTEHYVLKNTFYFFFTFICALSVLNWFWFSLMVKGIYSRVFKTSNELLYQMSKEKLN